MYAGADGCEDAFIPHVFDRDHIMRKERIDWITAVIRAESNSVGPKDAFRMRRAVIPIPFRLYVLPGSYIIAACRVVADSQFVRICQVFDFQPLAVWEVDPHPRFGHFVYHLLSPFIVISGPEMVLGTNFCIFFTTVYIIHNGN